MFAIARIFASISLLLVALLPVTALGQNDKFATNFPPELTFTETYAEKVVTEVDDGILYYWDVPDETSKFTTSGRVSAQGIDLSTLNGDSQFKFFLEFFRVSGKLSDDPEYVPGATSARIPLIAYDYDSDANIVAGYLAFSWNETEISFSAEVAAPETYSIVLDHYIDENEVFEDTATFHFTFAGRSLDRTVYYRGKATTKTREYGQGEDAEELDISTMDVTGALDSTGPKLAITAPAEGAAVSVDRISVSGTATDPRGVAEVAVQVNGGEFVPATMKGTGWSLAGVPLVVGANVIRAKAIDSEGNESTVQRAVTLLTPLTVTVSGSGTVSKEFRGTTFHAPGATVTIQAKASPGFIFSSWTGSVTSTEPSVSFVVQPGMTVTANFVPLPFGSLEGRYLGLLQSGEGAPTGMVQLTLSEAGSFTAKFSLDGRKTRLKGSFDATGRATGTLLRKGLLPLAYDLTLDVAEGSETITGIITYGGQQYTLTSDHAVYSAQRPSPYAGVYTALLRVPTEEVPGVPHHDGWASFKIRPDGKVKVVGLLADGTAFSTNTAVLKDGRMPLYFRGKADAEVLGGTLEFAEAAGAENDFEGVLTWSKEPGRLGPFPAGFQTDLQVYGVKYNPAQAGGLQLPNTRPNAEITLTDFGFDTDVELLITILPNGEVTLPNASGLKLKLKKATGTFMGSFRESGTGAPIRFRGVLLQKHFNVGVGLPLEKGGTGVVIIEPVRTPSAP